MSKNSIAQRIIDARKAKKWTQKDLANALNVNTKNVTRWELEQSAPSIQAAADLAKVLNLSLDYLSGLDVKKVSDPLVALLEDKAGSLSNKQKEALKTIIEAF